MEMGTQRSLWRGATLSQPGWALRLWLLLSVSGASEVFRPSLFQPQPSVVSGQGNPKIWCVVQGAPARAHVLSWYQQLMGKGPTFLLSQREGAPPAYGSGVNPRFLAETDPTRNAACLTVGNASPADEGTYYCAVWYSGQFIFGEGTRLLYQAERQPAPRPPQLSLFIPPSGPPFQALCVALGHHPDPLRVSWVLRGQRQEEEDFTGGAGAPTVSWLQLPQEVAGTSVTCQGLHQSGVLDVVLPLPWGQGCRGRLDTESWNEMHENGGDTALAELEQTLGAVTSCYLGLLSAALVYGLVLAAVWRSRYCCVHPVEPPTRAGQGAASGSGAQAGRRHAPAGALQREGRSPSSFRVLR
ncbi:immunoglobulin alpha-2 heavy chain-like [Pteropus vampyrus]|uniref:immunoglobulin alpha-2 heavy chain-like n=1 Tax=Pteropus vampyrus TaxID=132908 RepID=UPI0005BB236B|nr:immunoglobulin alpha-2 heavy chain-like [Pteropus vampyrus]